MSAEARTPLPPRLPITGDDSSDRLLETNPLALLIGMLLDQQIPMERAFAAPAKLLERTGTLECRELVALGEEGVVGAVAERPALHRFPASMGARVHALCSHIDQTYDGAAERLWTEAADGADLLGRLQALPGYGSEKARILMAILGKRLGVRPEGWEEACAPFSDDEPRSVADVADTETLARVRSWKQAMKAAKKSKQD